ncbi:MAG TPA: hypothetical protein VHS99_11530 [Chloroflexota bacterium]|nr:hypothetical protein [Chloroflexota bacterium]
MVRAGLVVRAGLGESGPPFWHRVIAAVRHRRGRSLSPPERALLQGLGLRRLVRGSNALYAFDHGGAPLCLKLYTATGEANARREWTALRLLERHGYPSAPAPVHLDLDEPPVALLMARLPGATIRHRRRTRAILAALAEALRAMYAITRADADDGSLPVVLNHQQVGRFLSGWIDEDHEHDVAGLTPLEREALTLVREWANGPDPEWIRRPAPLVFSRTDANFLNCLWDGRRIAIVDYEFAGWKDRVIDLADLIEVDAATAIIFRRPVTPLEDWAWFVERFELSGEERRRLLAAQRWLNWVFAFRAWRARAEPARPGPTRVASPAERLAGHVARGRALRGLTVE